MVVLGGLAAGVLAACVEPEDDTDLELLAAADETAAALDEVKLADPAGPVAVAANGSRQIRARKGVYWRYCTVTTSNATNPTGGQINITGSVSCDGTVSKITLTVWSYFKASETGPSYRWQGIGPSSTTNNLTMTLRNGSGCIQNGPRTWWGGETTYEIKFPTGYYPVAENGTSVSGTTASGKVVGNFSPYYCSPP